MFAEIETIIDYYKWSISEVKKLPVRERRHWYSKVKTKRDSGQ